jgi:hypothetical protein
MRFLSAVAIASLVAAGTANAQGAAASSQCTGVGGDACQQAVDYFRYMAPQLGTALTGGNTTIGQGGSMGGRTLGILPKFAISARVNVVMGNLPEYTPAAQGIGAPTPASRQLTTVTGMIPMPAVDVAVGVFKGIPLGVTNVGGVDILLSATYLPKLDTDNITITPEKSLSIGYGLRIGLLQEKLLTPGVGFSFLARSLPVTDISSSGSGASFAIDQFDMSSTSWRLTASKSLLVLGIAAGIGQDTYKTSINQISATMSPASPIVVPTMESEVTRTNMFVDATMNLFILKIVATGGMVSGDKGIVTYNTYDNPATKSRMYGSVGVRFGL